MVVYGKSHPDGSEDIPPMSTISFDDLLGRLFLLPMDKDGERNRAIISDHIQTISQDQVSREDQLKFQLRIDGDQLDDLISYNELMEQLEDNTDTGQHDNGLYRFKIEKQLQRHVLVMHKALYGTKSGGASRHHKLLIYQMGVKPSKADPDIWMKSSKDDNH